MLTPMASCLPAQVELAVQLGPDLKPVVAAVALDLTARDIQVSLRGKMETEEKRTPQYTCAAVRLWRRCCACLDVRTKIWELRVGGVC
eukprot:364069-Chlamydomonas_euryale.AAC.6